MYSTQSLPALDDIMDRVINNITHYVKDRDNFIKYLNFAGNLIVSNGYTTQKNVDKLIALYVKKYDER